MKFDVIIIGAGAAGLAAMDQLTSEGYKVCMFEAREIAGGRIATELLNGTGYTIETGAEFIHGQCPVTKEFLRKANIDYAEVSGKMITVRNGVWIEEEAAGHDHSNILAEKKKELKADCTIRQFLDVHLPSMEYDQLRRSIINFAEGFGLADINRASFFAFLKEWEGQESKQYRIPGGHQQLINRLTEWCTLRGGEIRFNETAHRIEFGKGSVNVDTSQNKRYEASKIIVTVSAGVLQEDDIVFVPTLAKQAGAIQQLGFGSIIKLIFLFRDPFWFDREKDLGFLLTDEPIPTWWTQLPDKTPILTGWLGGPKAALLSSLPDDKICEAGLSSLANIFGLNISFLRNGLVFYKIMCWDNYATIKGGYSFNTIDSIDAKSVLQEPIEDMIYFAGEAIYNGDVSGTVEAALASGKRTAGMITGNLSSAEN